MRKGRVRLLATIVVLAAVLGAGVPGWPQGPAQPPGGPDPNRLKAGKLEWSLYEAVQNTAGARQNYFGGSGDMALAVVELTGPLNAAQRQTLEQHGAMVLRVWGSTAYVRTTFDRLAEVGDLPFVRFLRRPRPPRPDQGAFEPWSAANLPEPLPGGATAGRTVTIGILDDFDFEHLPNQIAGKSTACRYNVVEHSKPGTHGNIVTEIVARMTAAVPSIQLCLYPVGTAGELRDIIAHAAAHNVDVLTNSMTFFDEYDYFDGHSQLAQDISRGLGSQIVFVVSAGNYGDEHYWGAFAHGTDRWHQFASGQQSLSLNIDGSVVLWLNWDSWRSPGGAEQSLDLFLYSDDLKTEVARSETSAEGEYFQWIERKDLHGVFKVLVKNSSFAVRPVAFHLFVVQDAEVAPGDRRLLTARRSLLGVVQPVENVIAVGAAQFPQGAMWEYSSQGPTGDDRTKPDLVGYSPVPSELKRTADGTAAAHGTSFTAPQVAAAAALLRAKNPGLSAVEIKRILMQSASAPPGLLGALFGTRNAYGAGILNVRRAFESALGFPVRPDMRGGAIFLHP